MDWTPTELQSAVEEVARPVLAGADDAWGALAEAQLLELDGPLELCTLLVEVGRAGGRAPVLETLVLGGPARATGRFTASDVLTAAFTEAGRPDPRRSGVRFEGGRLWGRKEAVPALPLAKGVVVAASDGLWLVDPSEAGVEPARATNGDAWGALVLDGTPAEHLGGVDALDAWRRRVHLGVAAHLLGLAQGALALTAAYVKERRQFGRPIGTFQAVTQRIADAWIDLQGLDAALTQAAWRLSEGLPCDREVLVARWLAAEAGHRVVATAQHLHGGFGFDRDYALHRYFLTTKAWEVQLGGPQTLLAELGDLVATAP